MLVQIYSKPDCSLCDEAKAVLREVQRRISFEWEEIDIRSDAALFERFQYDIPVVFVNGRKAFKHRIDAGQLEHRLRRDPGTAVAERDAEE